MISDWFGGLDAAWTWLAIGAVLATLELIVPGVFLIWLAIAAAVTGVLALVFDLGLAVQVINFAVLSLIAVYSAKRFLRDRPIESTNPLLNNRAGQAVGAHVVVSEAIRDGEGRVKLGDSEWIARGPDSKVGTRLRVVSAHGSVLTVE